MPKEDVMEILKCEDCGEMPQLRRFEAHNYGTKEVTINCKNCHHGTYSDNKEDCVGHWNRLYGKDATTLERPCSTRGPGNYS